MVYNIDVDQLNATAARLTGLILENKFSFVPSEDKHKTRLDILASVVHFLYRDLPCGLETTAVLIEDILKDHDYTDKSLVFLFDYNPAILDRNTEFNLIHSQTSFEVRASGTPSDLIGYDKKRVVFDEIQKCIDAAKNYKEYSTSPLCDNLLSATADRNNAKIFEGVYKNLVKDVKKYNISTTRETMVEDYLSTVFDKVQQCQDLLNPQTRFTQNVDKRRSRSFDDVENMGLTKSGL